MDKKSFIEKHGGKIGAILMVGGAVLGLGFFYYSYRKSSNRQDKDGNQSVASNSKSYASKDKRYINYIRTLREMVIDDIERGELSINTLMNMHEALMIAAGADYGKLVLKNREERRKIRQTNQGLYERLVIQEAEQKENLISQTIEKVANDCNCPLELYESSCASWAQKNPQFAMMSVLMIEKMKSFIPSSSKNNITPELVKEMLRFQISKYPKIDIEPSIPEIYGLLKQTWLSDITFEQFKVEEEELMKISSKTLRKNQDIQELAQQLQTIIQTDIMAKSGPMMM